MRKFRIYFDKEKEEVWLDKMCGQGWAMTGFCLGVYTFAPCKPGEYIYQVDMPAISRLGERDRVRKEYIEFVENTGAEYVCSWGFYMIFRKEAAKGEFKLYTDAESQMKLYQRIRLLFLAVMLYDLWVCIMDTGNFWNYSRDFLLEEHGNLLCLDGAPILVLGLALIYLITLVMFVMVVRMSRKIHRLKKEKFFP